MGPPIGFRRVVAVVAVSVVSALSRALARVLSVVAGAHAGACDAARIARDMRGIVVAVYF
jgi:hypothetical protein